MSVESGILSPAESINPNHELVRPGEILPEAVERIRSEELGIDDDIWEKIAGPGGLLIPSPRKQEGLLEQLGKYDPDVYEHSLRSAAYIYGITKLLEDREDTAAGLFLAMCLHDIGKYGIHTDLINYPGVYDREEQHADMRRHPWIGFQALRNAGFPPEVTLPVAWHHRFPPEGEAYGYGPTLDSEDIRELKLSEADIDRGIAGGKELMLIDNFDSSTRTDHTGGRILSPEERYGKLLNRFPNEGTRINWLFDHQIETVS